MRIAGFSAAAAIAVLDAGGSITCLVAVALVGAFYADGHLHGAAALGLALAFGYASGRLVLLPWQRWRR